MKDLGGLIPKGPLAWSLLTASLAAFGANFRLLRGIGRRLEEETGGHEALDFQGFGLTAGEVRGQLSSYTGEAAALYRRFFVADIPLPLLGSIGLAVALSILLRANPDAAPFYRPLLRLEAPFLAFALALFDWGENTCFLVAVERRSEGATGVARAAVAFHRLKLASLFAAFSLVFALLTFNGYSWLRREHGAGR